MVNSTDDSLYGKAERSGRESVCEREPRVGRRVLASDGILSVMLTLSPEMARWSCAVWDDGVPAATSSERVAVKVSFTLPQVMAEVVRDGESPREDMRSTSW